MSEEPKRVKPKISLCWDCSNATGGCRWSMYLKPVPGWQIIPTKKTTYDGHDYTSCIVLECPEFNRDAVGGGMKRYKDGKVYVSMPKYT